MSKFDDFFGAVLDVAQQAGVMRDKVVNLAIKAAFTILL